MSNNLVLAPYEAIVYWTHHLSDEPYTGYRSSPGAPNDIIA